MKRILERLAERIAEKQVMEQIEERLSREVKRLLPESIGVSKISVHLLDNGWGWISVYRKGKSTEECFEADFRIRFEEDRIVLEFTPSVREMHPPVVEIDEDFDFRGLKYLVAYLLVGTVLPYMRERKEGE